MTDFSHGVSALAALFVVHLLVVASPVSEEGMVLV